MSQGPSFMETLKKHDPEFFELVAKVMDKAQGEGVLDQKTKTLIMMALDTALGHPEGVKALSQRARSLGATEAEIIEVLRLAFLVSGIPGIATGSSAFSD